MGHGEPRGHDSWSGSLKPTIPVCLAVILVLSLGGWGAYEDWSQIRQTVITSEITRIRSHAIRTANGLERVLWDSPNTTLDQLADLSWLREHWAKFIPPPDSTHGAVVDPNGRIVAHSDPVHEGQCLCPNSNAYPVPEAGPEVYATSCAALTGGPWSLDISVPIKRNGQIVGTYHVGASQDWIDLQTMKARRRSALGWGVVIGGILAGVMLSSLSLYNITRRSALLEAALKQSQTRRLAEIHYLMIGMAHEVRNHLNAVRLNLYTTERVYRGAAVLEPEEVSAMLSDSHREIERVDHLMTLLLGYARADDAEPEVIDLVSEIRNVVHFLAPTFNARSVHLTVNLPADGEYAIFASRSLVRQVVLNLLTNAADAVSEKSGEIGVTLDGVGQSVSLTVTDNGPGVPEQHRHRLFSPFFTTKEQGTGLGLALVRSHVERAGGRAECLCGDAGHCQFLVTWPLCVEQTALCATVST